MNNEYKSITKLIKDTFAADYNESVLDFISFLNSQSMIFERLYGYWKNQNYYSVKYNNEVVCYILISGTGDEAQFAPLTIWTDDSNINCYENIAIEEHLKKCAWNQVDYCVHCGSCSGGTQKVIFGKSFDNVCRTLIRLTNPDKEAFVLIKKLVSIRKKYIDN